MKFYWLQPIIIVLTVLLPSSHTFAHLNGYWRNGLDQHSIIHVDDETVSLHNGDAKLSMQYKRDPILRGTYHFNNLRFNRLALPASLPNISLSTAMNYITLLKKHGATIYIQEDHITDYPHSVIIVWRVHDRSGTFTLDRVL